ncbi:MAG: IclR family transcriptional regulator [Deltaproteobacteria bacterium]|nr:IclR family transcriptional regulator [Deltaproteobacteria bacterium]
MVIRKKDSKPNGKYIVPAIVQAARVLLCLAESESSHLSLTEICSRVGIHSSRAYSLLYTLQEFGFIHRNVGGKGYSLGTGLLALSRKVLDNLNAPRLAGPILENLAKIAENTAALALINEDKLSIVAKHEGGQDVGITVRVGRTFHLTHSAEGKAIAAFLPEEELKRLLKRKDLYFQDKSGKLDKEKLLRDLEECRRLGYALDYGEVNPRFNAVASPVLGPAGKPVGCITVIGILSSDRARQLGPEVAKAGKELSRLLGSVAK